MRKTFTHIHSEVFETSEFAEVFLKFGVNIQIFGFGIFQEGPEFLQPIELTCRERGERQREAENKGAQRRLRCDVTDPRQNGE